MKVRKESIAMSQNSQEKLDALDLARMTLGIAVCALAKVGTCLNSAR